VIKHQWGVSKMKVSELAESLAVTPDTVRFYTRAGFICPAKNSHNGYKEYSKEDKNRLRFIVDARQIGFSVKDIEQILNHAEQDESACPIVRKLIEERLEQTEVQFQQIKTLRNNMKRAIDQWQNLPDKTSSNEIICHLIDTFAEDNHTQQKTNKKEVTK